MASIRLIYEQSTGRLYADGKLMGTGYSGAPGHVNKHIDEKLANKGPIPCGVWSLAPCHTKHPLGRLVIELKPDARTQTYGRSEFFIHADRAGGRAQSASNGCIVMPDNVRNGLMGNAFDKLVVVERYQAEDAAGGDTAITTRAAEIGLKAGVVAAAKVTSKPAASSSGADAELPQPKCGAMPVPAAQNGTPFVSLWRLSTEYSKYWIYCISNGCLLVDGVLIAIGYSGAPEALNQPGKQALANRGPIPSGLWRVVRKHDNHPAFGAAIELTPIDHNAHGRSEFFLHSVVHNRSVRASKGCIILTERAIEWLGSRAHGVKLMVVE